MVIPGAIRWVEYPGISALEGAVQGTILLQPLSDASWCPSADDCKGTPSAILVGREDLSFSIHLKSAMAWWTPFFSVMRLPCLVANALCILLKRDQEPSNAMDMERSSPNALCHLLMLVRFWWDGMLARILSRLSW